ncbi:MAG TPA: heme-dependent oxidative N-demethylase subunit alpha family protein [Puia sp.]|nr:heme-dependent oxidative N-demethylase subunit alpha family protein [Puia sp.]
MAKASEMDQATFQLDDQYDLCLSNKLDCRKEDIHKYYLEKDLYPDTLINANKFLAGQLVKEHPADFALTGQDRHYTFHNKRTGEILEWKNDWISIEHGTYVSLFDALSSQVQEDIAICQLENEKDWLAAIHLSAPNHWPPAEKIGKPFGAIHSVVPGMEKLNEQYFRMLVTLVQKGPFIRFAWGISTDTRLNHHPIPPPGIDPINWQGRSIEDNDSKIYLRVERQVINGIPACNAFIFTIRTYFYDIDELQADEKKALLMAVESMSPSSLEYKGLTNKTDILRKRLLSI